VFWQNCFYHGTGLADGLFTNPKSPFLKNFMGLRLEDIYKFSGHLDYFMDIWDIL
jgi:uncharacterized protein (DUF1919 family)